MKGIWIRMVLPLPFSERLFVCDAAFLTELTLNRPDGNVECFRQNAKRSVLLHLLFPRQSNSNLPFSVSHNMMRIVDLLVDRVLRHERILYDSVHTSHHCDIVENTGTTFENETSRSKKGVLGGKKSAKLFFIQRLMLFGSIITVGF